MLRKKLALWREQRMDKAQAGAAICVREDPRQEKEARGTKCTTILCMCTWLVLYVPIPLLCEIGRFPSPSFPHTNACFV